MPKEPSTQNIVDIAIVGGGPTGLFSAFYCGMRNATCSIIDSLPELGGQLAALYPEKYIFDVGGYPKILARTLVEHLKEQAFQYHPTVYLNERVLNFNKRADGVFELITDKRVHLARALILCAGIGLFTPRPLPGENATDYENKGVYYYLDNLDNFRGKQVLVVGGGDTALDYALMLEPVANHVILIHRRDQFRAHEESVHKLQNSSVEVLLYTELQLVHGRGHVDGVTVIQNKTKETRDFSVDAIVSGLGFSASLGPIAEWGLEIQNNEVVVNTRMETNISGVYAVGDIVTYPGKVKLIATGLGEAPTAVNNAKTYVDPNAHLSPGHSSSRS